MEQRIKDALDVMLGKLKDINLQSQAGREKIIEGIEATLKDHNQETKEKVFQKVESLLED